MTGRKDGRTGTSTCLAQFRKDLLRGRRLQGSLLKISDFDNTRGRRKTARQREVRSQVRSSSATQVRRQPTSLSLTRIAAIWGIGKHAGCSWCRKGTGYGMSVLAKAWTETLCPAQAACSQRELIRWLPGAHCPGEARLLPAWPRCRPILLYTLLDEGVPKLG